MACKSLWTNKLRSFLTMLGIIIGVLTVSLLTTVAQGVSDAVVSSIRTQSTLGVVMSTSRNITYGDMVSVLNENRPEDKDDEKYFEYSMVYSSNRAISMDLTDYDISDTSAENFNSILKWEDISDFQQKDEEIDARTDLSHLEKELLKKMKMIKQKSAPINASVYAVDKNFTNVYEMKFEGKFPEKDNEILVDEEFIKTYLGKDVAVKDAIGESISLGINYYTSIVFNFQNTVSDSDLALICKYLQREYPDGVDESTGSQKFKGLGLTVIKNEDGSLFTRLEENSVEIKVEFNQMFTSELLIFALKMGGVAEISDNVNPMNPSSILVNDVYDASNYKTYTIVGVLKQENSSITSSMGSSSSDESTNILSQILGATQKGTCYMILDSKNFASLDLGDENTNISGIPISYAYMRYKTEDVMEESTTDIMFSLIGRGFGLMKDFMIVSMSSVANIISNVMNILTIMLTVISVISLIVGGIGIMNIMLVAVTERTREIGVRKAIGAKRGSILVQFLIEALMLSLIGGAIGLAISGIGAAIIGHVMGIALAMPFWVIAMSVGFCTAIGLIFGMFPAVKASRMQPIDALRRD